MKKKALPKSRGAEETGRTQGYFPGGQRTAIREDRALKGSVMGKPTLQGRGGVSFLLRRLLWALGHADTTEPRETLTVCPSHKRAALWTQGKEGGTNRE